MIDRNPASSSSTLRRAAILAGALVFPLALAAAALRPEGGRANAANDAFFRTQVRPILQASCVPCHGGAQPSGDLSLASRAATLKGGASGPALVPGKATPSLLVRAINHDGRKMPPQGKLPQAQIDTLTRWVSMGAPWPDEKTSAPAAPAPHGPPPVNPQTMKFWSFQPVKPVALPPVKQAAWATNPVDRFILAKLEKSGFSPAPPATRPALVRRAYYDMLGLPPTPREVEAFVSDQSPNAWEKVVDRLLASPRYGERWARHWLDLVRYGETNSFERDSAKPFVWRYRDYVIRSFNADKPYDRFVKEQIAGDEMPDGGVDGLIATGYYRLGTWDDEPSDPDQAHADELDDVVSTTGQTFLGLTVGCARCHDHKIDPVPQKDYYRLVAIFNNTTRYSETSLRPIAPLEDQKRYNAQLAIYKEKLGGIEAKVKAVDKLVAPDLQPVEKEDYRFEDRRPGIVKKRVGRLLTEAQFDDYARLTSERDTLRKSPPPALAQALCVTEFGANPGPTYILMRGNPHAQGDAVQPGFPSVLAPPDPAIHAIGESSGRRTALADWLAGPKNPLTARVMANRVWQFHFGRGIVRTPSNFGFLGAPPTHPELLDWLAGELVRDGWRLKPLHKLILMSNAYRMSSRPDPKAFSKDPENDLFQHFDMRRLDAEEIRDSILAVNGTLNPKMFGPPIYPTMPPEVLASQSMPGAGWAKSTPEEQARRSIYIHIKRSLTLPMLATFDVPETDFTCPARNVTTQPTQALGMLNSTFLNEQAAVFAATIRNIGGTDHASQVRFALQRVFQRDPTAAEVTRGVKLIDSTIKRYGKSESEALKTFCLVALNLNEFVYLD